MRIPLTSSANLCAAVPAGTQQARVKLENVDPSSTADFDIEAYDGTPQSDRTNCFAGEGCAFNTAGTHTYLPAGGAPLAFTFTGDVTSAPVMEEIYAPGTSSQELNVRTRIVEAMHVCTVVGVVGVVVDAGDPPRAKHEQGTNSARAARDTSR